jgi:hypothetical protein
VAEFLRTLGHPDPRDVTPDQILDWRDELVRRKQKPNTVCLKLSVVRSFYECLMAGGYVSMNPVTAKLVPPPALPEDLAGKALTPKEVKRLLAAQIESRRECQGLRHSADAVAAFHAGFGTVFAPVVLDQMESRTVCGDGYRERRSQTTASVPRQSHQCLPCVRRGSANSAQNRRRDGVPVSAAGELPNLGTRQSPFASNDRENRRTMLGKSGSLVDTKRRDFMPFGKDLNAGQFGRTTAQGCEPSGTPSNPREKFAACERDEHVISEGAQRLSASEMTAQGKSK